MTVNTHGPGAVTGAVVRDAPGAGIACPAANAVTVTGNGVPAGAFTVASRTGAGIALGALASGQSATLAFRCTVNCRGRGAATCAGRVSATVAA
nr:hypothetical protein [Lysobacter silvisoli]